MNPNTDRFALLSSTLVFALLIAGCGSSSAPSTGMNGNDVQAALANTSPQNQIDWINRSPMSPDEKAKKIAEIQKKYNLPADSSAGH